MSRLCKLQINTMGAWRNVLAFDLDQVDHEALQVTAAQLVVIADPEGRTSLRVIADDGFQTVLVHWTAKKGWVPA